MQNYSTLSISLPQIKETSNTKQTIKKIADYITNTFSKTKPKEEDRPLTDIKIIKTKKLTRDIKNIENFIKDILIFIEKGVKYSEESTIFNIQNFRTSCGKQIHSITSNIESIRKEYPELENKDFLEIDEIKKAEDIKNQLIYIEKVFQKLRMQQKKPFEKPKISTIDELYSLLNQEVYYTTKGDHKKRKTKITNISPNRKNNEIIIQMEMETGNKTSRKFEFATAFKGNNKDIIQNINTHIDANIKSQEFTRPSIDRQELYDKITNITNNHEPKVIELQRKQFGKEHHIAI